MHSLNSKPSGHVNDKVLGKASRADGENCRGSLQEMGDFARALESWEKRQSLFMTGSDARVMEGSSEHSTTGWLNSKCGTCKPYDTGLLGKMSRRGQSASCIRQPGMWCDLFVIDLIPESSYVIAHIPQDSTAYPFSHQQPFRIHANKILWHRLRIYACGPTGILY